MKSRVIRRREPIDPRCAAYVQQVRTFNRTKRELAVNPYAEVYEFRDGVYGIYSHSADGMGDPWSFLVLGPERAMLIDTGFGIGDLRGLADEIAEGRPLDVVNTHPHVDHCFGNAQFDRVYCHSYAVPYLQAQASPRMWDHLIDEHGHGRWLDFDVADIVGHRDHEIVGVPNHHLFDLGGGHEIELVHTAGHHAAHSVLLDHGNRILFGGDAFVASRVHVSGPKPGMPYGEYASVAAFRREIALLAERTSEFDTIYPAHFILDLEPGVVDGLLEACERALADPESPDFRVDRFGREARLVTIPGLGFLAYNESSIGSANDLSHD